MLYAMFAVVVLTYIIGIIALKARVNSVKSGAVKIKYFRTMQGKPETQEQSVTLPDEVIKSTRQFNNLFETPVLFYVAGVLYLSLGIDSLVAVYVTWVFVALRVCLLYTSPSPRDRG